MQLKPPDIASDRLFRSLLATPKPKQALQFRLAGTSEAFYVQAISSHEIADAPTDALQPFILSKCLVTRNNRPIFSSPENITNLLSVAEYKRLSNEALKILNQISPMFGYCDYKAWSTKLEEGAKHPNNHILMVSLGQCFSLISLPDRIITQDHPELYFGVPRNQLIDCHWLAYYAARRVYKELALDQGSEQKTIQDLKKITKGEML